MGTEEQNDNLLPYPVDKIEAGWPTRRSILDDHPAEQMESCHQAHRMAESRQSAAHSWPIAIMGLTHRYMVYLTCHIWCELIIRTESLSLILMKSLHESVKVRILYAKGRQRDRKVQCVAEETAQT